MLSSAVKLAVSATVRRMLVLTHVHLYYFMFLEQPACICISIGVPVHGVAVRKYARSVQDLAPPSEPAEASTSFVCYSVSTIALCD